MNALPLMTEVTDLHRERIITWKTHGVKTSQTNFLGLVEENHAFNYQLWHAEDRARRDDLGYEYVYRAKRDIDGFNQQRNDRMEMMDEWIYHHLQASPSSSCPLHTETPGMIIDRLSILSLKAYHMNEQTLRHDVNDAHRQQCAHKTQVIDTQRTSLVQALQLLIDDIQNKTRTFRVYHQFKMYNNPQLYGSGVPA